MALNDEIRDEFHRVKKKGRIAILKWYWEYFKIHTLVAVFAVIFVVSTVRSIMNQKPDYVNAIFLNAGGYTLDYNQILTVSESHPESTFKSPVKIRRYEHQF